MNIEPILLAMKATLLNAATIKTLVGTRVCVAVAGQVPEGWMTRHALAISPDLTTPITYPASWPNHTALNVTVYAYIEHFGEEAGLFELLRLEQAVLDVLIPNGNEEFESFGGLVSACFWRGTSYPEAHLRNFEKLNEARLRFEYRL